MILLPEMWRKMVSNALRWGRMDLDPPHERKAKMRIIFRHPQTESMLVLIPSASEHPNGSDLMREGYEIERYDFSDHKYDAEQARKDQIDIITTLLAPIGYDPR